VFVTTPGRGGFEQVAPAEPDATPAGPMRRAAAPATSSEPARATAPGAADASAPGTAAPSPAEQADPRLQRLDDPDPFVRIGAIDQLRGHPALVGMLVDKLHDDFPVVRRQAVRALKEAGTADATKALLEVANQDPSAEVREEAVGALAALLRDAKGQPARPPGPAPEEPRTGTNRI
jgi:HEAT repeat protein